MSILPKALQNLIDELGKLPGVGPRTAERYAYFLLKAGESQANSLANVLSQLTPNIKLCPVTFMLISADEEVSSLYSDPHRDKTVVAVVEEPLDVVTIEKTGSFKGTYHVLGGVISPIDGVGPEQLKITQLVERIKKDNIQEIILATNASIEGESTALYIQKQLEDFKDIKITRLARGLPAGTDIEYADQTTLIRALEERQAL